MTRVPEKAAGGQLPGLALCHLLLIIVMVIVAALLLMAPSAAADRSVDLTWLEPQTDVDVFKDVDVGVRASANVTNVTFYYRSDSDYHLIGNGTFSAPDSYRIVWDTRTVTDGTYELMANATLAGGGYAQLNVTDIRVDNTAPTIFFINPSSGIRLNGLYIIRTQTTPDVVAVDLFIDTGSGFVPMGNAQHEVASVNWTFVWNTTSYSELKDVDLLAAARDAAGNEHRTAVLGIHIDNVPPTATLVAPVENVTLDGYVHLKANTTEEHIADVYFQWREGDGEWERIADANWNSFRSLWMYHWNTYEVGEHTEVEVRITVMDDLGQKGHASVGGITISDLPPEPEFLVPAEGDHLTDEQELCVVSQNDTVNVVFSYFNGTGWVDIGQAEQHGEEVWNLSWDTTELSLYETIIQATAYDATGNGSVLIDDIEVDNTSPAPQILTPTTYQYHLFGTIPLVVISDRDTVAITFHYEDEDEWVFFFESVYNANTDRWEGVWFIPEELYIDDSAICATAIDEVGLRGTYLLDHREIGKRPGDYAPMFESSMPEVIYLVEDQEYLLKLADHVDDDDKSTLKLYVTNEPKDLFYVDGENVTGQLDLNFITLPDQNGEAVVIIHVVDPAGQRDMAFLQVIIDSLPDPPYFTSIPPNLYVRPEVPYTFNFGPYVNDEDSKLEDLVILNPDDNHVSKVSTNPLVLEFSYSKGELDKTFFVNITLRDPDGLIAYLSIMVWVVDDWVPELRNPLPDIWMEEDHDKIKAFNLDAFFHDKDQDALYYSYGNKYVRVVIGNDYPHPVSIYPPKNWYGTDSVTFRATDPTGALLEDTILVRCNSTNDPPVFLDNPEIPDLVIRANESYNFDLSPYVIDVDHELGELIIHTNDPRTTRSTLCTLGIRLNYEMMPDFILILTIEDPDGNTTEPRSMNVYVTNNHPPMMRDPPPDLVMVEGETRAQAFSVTSAFDPDWYDEPGSWEDLTFEFISSSAQFTVVPEGWVGIQLPDADFNTYNGSANIPLTILFRVMDVKGGFSEYTFLLTVLPVNDAPEVDEIGLIQIQPSIVTIDLRNYIRDVDTPFTELGFEVEDANIPGRTISYVSVHGWLLVLDYKGSHSRMDRLVLFVVDYDHRVSTQLVVKVEAQESEDPGFAWWTILLLVLVTGVVAVVASKFVWGRYEHPSVSDVFLVYGDGVIIRHISKRGTISMDEDLAIAMLTAIQEFVQQSMRSAQLKSMQAGENSILIERDPSRLFYIAVIHTGTVSEELRKAINFATMSIKEDFAKTLAKWDGNIAKFDGVERYMEPILAISHASIPEGVRFEMEGITSIEPGKTYMFHGKDVTRTHNIFRGLVEDAGSGLLISRVHPQRLHPSIPEAGAECIWLSKTPTKRGVSPSNTTMILHEIVTYVKENKRTVVCLDGLEYLLVHNPLDEVVAFVSELTDMVQVDDFIMMIHVDPYALDDATLAKLSRNMVPVSDRTPSNGK
ncbi:MAG: DUF835 domain-containing protein [Thermoplasmata archaeon]|nr:DUF835 domain-containing protein [Thermoplasmata archaeon]